MYEKCVRVAFMLAVFMLVTCSPPAVAHPNCWEVQGVDPCPTHCGEPCCGYPCPAGHPTTFFKECEGGQRLWMISWSCGCYTDWDYCWCDQGGGGCFLAGSPVEMADGTIKSIEEIRAGDRVRSYDEHSESMSTGTVAAALEPHAVDFYFIINGSIRASAAQPVLSHGQWIKVGDLKIGDALTSAEGKPVPVVTLQRVEEKTTVYNVQIDGLGTYVVHGIIVHNKSFYVVYPGHSG